MAILAGSVFALPQVRTYAQVMLYGIAMGISGGVVTVIFFSVWGQVFGRSHLGRIQGCAQMMTVFASALGPLLLARTFQRTGSYDVMFYGLSLGRGRSRRVCLVCGAPRAQAGTAPCAFDRCGRKHLMTHGPQQRLPPIMTLL